MLIERRKFLGILGVAAGAAGLGSCSRQWAVPERLVDLALRGPGLESETQTICNLCEGGCGVTVRLVDGLPVGIKGNPNHPLNQGGMCPVGHSALEVLYSPERLQGPMQRQPGGGHARIEWNQALDEIGSRLAQLSKTADGARQIALLSGEPSLLFHDLARQFMFALGSPNVTRPDNDGVLPYLLSQGIDEVPGFDLARSDLVLSFGLDLFEDGPAPIHAIAALIGSRTAQGRSSVIHVGTRLSPSAAKADLFVGVRPGTHGAFALGVAHVLVREGNYNHDFVANHTFGFEDGEEMGRSTIGFRRLLLERYYPDRVATICGCDASTVARVARRIAEASAPLAIAGGEVTRHDNATWNVLAVHALNALTGAFDRPGGVVLPSAIPLTPLERPSSFPAQTQSIFDTDSLPRRDPIQTLADHILDGTHSLEAVFLIGCNPVYESVAGRRLGQALDQIPLVVALNPFLDETAAHADYILPAHVFLESWQSSTTPLTTAFSSLGLAQPVVDPLFDTRHPGDVLLQLSQRAGTANDSLPWPTYPDYLKHRLQGLVLSGEGSLVTGSFEESWKHFLEERGWRFLEHRGLEDFWADLVRQAGWWSPVPPPGDRERLFRTPSGRYEFFSQTLQQRLRLLAQSAGSQGAETLQPAIEALNLTADPDEVCLPHFEPPQEAGEGQLTLIPFRPITSRGRLGKASPMLMEMFGYTILSGWQTWAELASDTAHEMDLEDGDHVVLETDRDSIKAVVRIQPGALPGLVHVPLGLGRRETPEADGVLASNPLDIVVPVGDSLAGTLSLNSTRVSLRLIRRRPHGGPPPAHKGEAE